MRTLVAILTGLCVSLAIASGYLYRELQSARRESSAVHPVQHDPRQDAPFEPDIIEPESTAPVDPAPSGPDIREPQTPADLPDRRAEQRAQVARRWSDPAFRTVVLARARERARHETPDVAVALHLDRAQEDALVELLAQQSLQIDETESSRRFATTEAERAALQRQITELRQRHEQERAELLGQGRYAQFQQYSQQVPERQQLRELRARLDAANGLTADQSNRLIDAMYQERDSYLQRLKSVEGVGGYSPAYPFEAFSQNRNAAARVRFAEQQMVRTQEFTSQLRLRASSILSAEQLHRFDEIQDEQLAHEQARVERLRNRANRPQRQNQRRN